jgi:hypothetical protein
MLKWRRKQYLRHCVSRVKAKAIKGETHANDQETKRETAARECNKWLNKKQKGAVSCLSEIRFLGAPAISERLRAGYKMVAASRALTNARSSMPVQCTKRTSFDGLD